MRQDTPCVTAPKDPTPKWPEGYLSVLRAVGAQEKNIPYCISWVQRFFSRHPGRAEHELGRTEIEGFLTEIAAHPGISNWQVQQARNALELYYEKFRGIALSPRNCLPTDDFAVSVHSTHEPVLKTRPPNALTQKDNPTTKAVYTRPFGDVNTKVDEKHNEKHNAMPGPIRGLDGATGDDTQVAQHSSVENKPGRCDWNVLKSCLQEVLRIEHYSYATEKTYITWIERYVAFHGWRKPSALEAHDVRAFLKHLAIED